MIYNDTVKLSNGTEQHNSTSGIFSNFVVTSSLKMQVRNTTYSSSHALYNMMWWMLWENIIIQWVQIFISSKQTS